MSAQMKIKTHCPVCKTAYQVPDSSVGHRARCPKCDSVFRVVIPGVQKPAAEPHRPANAGSDHPGNGSARPPQTTPERPRGVTPQPPQATERPADRPHRSGRAPTDDDIVGWLMEGTEKDDLPLEPRWWHAPPEPARKATA